MFRLGEEEDAIRAKVSEYQRGGNAVLDEAARSWDSRILQAKLGKDNMGATQEWKKIRRVSDVAKMVEAREQELLAGLEMLSNGADA